ncbi:DNA binding protein, putative [Ricinus communis]|uniref:DNA binding protein, putative n=1 Tax=Ricinus communis TaxID=3988 RepID=B9SHX6_RICCO|nr:DNA binding protein, putative [Ricinus communis]|eukprot:XP_002525595.1 transcription factor DIVARICATA [Ricinus communis]
MKWDIGVLSPTSYLSSTNWLIEESKNTKWTPAENKMFENALAVYDKDTPDRWHKVAAMIPGKTVGDVIKQYRELEVDVNNIEAGLVPIPGYNTSAFTLDWVNSNSYDGFKPSYAFGGKRSSSGRPADQERKKGVPWTEEEHKLFLMGLKKYGKGDWRNISRNFVVTRTPTQVASHAQKYFIRQLSGGKDKRRASIHDITTVNLNEIRTPSPENKRQASPDQSSVFSQQSNGVSLPRTHFQWNQPNSGAIMAFNSTNGNMFTSSTYGVNSYGMKLQGYNLHSGSLHESYIGPQTIAFQMQSAQHYPDG